MTKQDKSEFELLNLQNDEWSIVEGVLLQHRQDLRDSKEIIRVPDGVKKINPEAFSYKIKKLYLPNSVQIICCGAFDCSLVESIYIENGEIYLENGCFAYIDILKEVYIQGKKINTIVTQSHIDTDDNERLCLEKYIGNDNIYYVDDDIKEIGAMAFSGCDNVKEIILSNSVESIGMYAFSSSLTSIKLTDSLKKIGIGAFAYCNYIDELTIPQSVTAIGKDAFDGWESWQKINMPNHFKMLRLFQKWRNGCKAKIIYY